MKLSDFSVLTFDCYGTLIDWETGIWDALQPLILQNRRTDLKRQHALSVYGELESSQEAATPALVYEGVLEAVHKSLSAELGLETTPTLDRAFGASVRDWPAFPDTADALRRLASRFKLVILSNISNESFAASARKLGVAFDAIYTAEDIGSYKPADENFAYLFDALARDLASERAEVLHVAQSLFHDHTPASRAGLATAWIDRQRLSEGGSWGATAKVEQRPAVDFKFYSLEEFADATEAFEAGS